MTVQELIAALELLASEGHGDMEVCVWNWGPDHSDRLEVNVATHDVWLEPGD